jgi:hypothetical protein
MRKDLSKRKVRPRIPISELPDELQLARWIKIAEEMWGRESWQYRRLREHYLKELREIQRAKRSQARIPKE